MPHTVIQPSDPHFDEQNSFTRHAIGPFVRAIFVEFGVENWILGGKQQTAVAKPEARSSRDVVNDVRKVLGELLENDFRGALVEDFAQAEKVQIFGKLEVDSMDESIDDDSEISRQSAVISIATSDHDAVDGVEVGQILGNERGTVFMLRRGDFETRRSRVCHDFGDWG